MIDAREAGSPLADLRRALAEAETRLDALEATEQRILAAIAAGREPGPESSLMKVQGTELLQRLDELTLEIAGSYAAPDHGDAVRGLNPALAVGPQDAMTAAPKYLNNRAASIYAGSNEIQRNIIAGQVLKL
jgi:acyl-CoA dehydrogenase